MTRKVLVKLVTAILDVITELNVRLRKEIKHIIRIIKYSITVIFKKERV